MGFYKDEKNENLRLLAVLITLLNYWLCKDRENISAKVNHIITYHFNFFSPLWSKTIHYYTKL